jgi:hypothetical protein
MSPCNRLDSGLDRLQGNGCSANSTVQNVKQDYERLADKADQLLQEKQEREQVKSGR